MGGTNTGYSGAVPDEADQSPLSQSTQRGDRDMNAAGLGPGTGAGNGMNFVGGVATCYAGASAKNQ